MKVTWIVGALLAARAVAGAAGVDCHGALTSPEMAACLQVRVAVLEARLGRVERAVRRGILRQHRPDAPADDGPAPEVRFDAAATAWERYRDAACDAQAALYADTPIEPVMRLVCRANQATARLRDLKHPYRDVLRD